MKAIISGQAAVAVFSDGEKMWSVNLDNLDKKIRCSESDLRFLFAGATDVVELEDVTEEEALKELELAWKKDRAMHLILILLDNEEAEETRQLAAECLEEFLPDSEVEEFVFNRMYAAPLPDSADLPGSLKHAKEAKSTCLRGLLGHLKSDQSEITHLCNAWNALPIKLFGSLEDADIFKQAAIRAGAFRLLVTEDYRYNKILSKLLDAAQFRVHPKGREILAEWMLTFRLYTHRKILSTPDAVVPLSDSSLMRESENPLAEKFKEYFNRSYGEDIFFDEEEQLYIRQREWLVDRDFTPKEYEAYLQHLFFDEEAYTPLIILSGEVGCGKSTLLQFYLKYYRPHNAETAKKWTKKLTLSVDAEGVKSINGFDHRFFKSTRRAIIDQCREAKVDIKEALPKKSNDRRWVESALEYLSDMIEKPKSAHNTPFQYIVLLIDNLDQSPINVVEHAITTIINGWHERGSRIKLWQIFLPLRPSTLHTLRMRRVVFPSNVVVPLGRVDYVKLLEARTKWVRNAIRETGDSIAYEDSNHNRYVKDNSGCVRYFDDVLSTVKNYNPEFMNFVPKIVDGDLNRALGIWYGLCASEVMFWTHEQIYPISLYELRCAMLSGKYRVQDRDMPCVGNLFFMTDRFVSAHDLLIGPHMLFLLQEDDLYENLHVALEDLGYQKNRIKSVAKKFQEM